ncbi:hypothetical protein [Micromonospora zamorensis]|uniref:hypothetical protein n=1 Tax=Micromonospora zamorensis TaxID=709883 RepID=UPI0033D2F2E3
MNGRRVVAGGTLLAVGTIAAVLAAPVLLAGDLATLPIMIFGGGAAAFGAVWLRDGLRAPAPRRGARAVPGPRRRHADTSIPSTYYGDSNGWNWSGGDSGGGSSGGGGDSGGGGGGGGGGS